MTNSDFFIKQSLEYAKYTNTEPIQLTIKGEKFFAFECINSDGDNAYLGFSPVNGGWSSVLIFDKGAVCKNGYFKTHLAHAKDFKEVCKNGFKLLSESLY